MRYLDVVEIDFLEAGIIGFHLLKTYFHICGVGWFLKYRLDLFTFDHI